MAEAGIASVYVGWRQWSAINGQLKEMRAAAAQANKLIQVNADLATAAKSQAAATQLMAEATRDIQIDSRATITAALQIQSPPSGVVVPDQPANFTFFVSNNGFGTARDFRVWAKAEVHEFPLNSQIVVKTPRVAPTTLAKDGMSQPVIATTESPVAKSDFDAIQRGEKAVYIFGEATYLDPYQTAFDFPIRYIYGKGSPTPVPGDFTVAENPN